MAPPKLTKKQKKLDKNKNGRIDAGDFRMMRHKHKKGTSGAVRKKKTKSYAKKKRK